MVSLKKKSPRAPSISLDEALERTFRAYDKDRLHAAPTEVFAQNIGYKSANNGAALAVLASLRYFGLVERPEDGMMAVVKDVESLKFAPDPAMRRSLTLGFLRTPPLYDELLTKYESGLPSDANLRYELIQRGFTPQTAEGVLAAFRRSVSFADFYNAPISEDLDNLISGSQITAEHPASSTPQQATQRVAVQTSVSVLEEADHDKIPVRLPGGRRAWLVIPSPFFSSDKNRLKAQIDLLLTEDDE